MIGIFSSSSLVLFLLSSLPHLSFPLSSLLPPLALPSSLPSSLLSSPPSFLLLSFPPSSLLPFHPPSLAHLLPFLRPPSYHHSCDLCHYLPLHPKVHLGDLEEYLEHLGQYLLHLYP